MIKVINKGYTLTVTSWENDGDNYKTESITVDTIEEAQKINKICKELFISKNREGNGIGNSMDGEAQEIIEDYIKDNPEMNLTEDYIDNLATNLLGSSEYYDYRVFENLTVTYSPEDIYLEQITF